MQALVESRLHLFAATQASNISAKTFLNRYSTNVKQPIDRRTAASWKLRPCNDDEIKYVKIIALNIPNCFRLWKMSAKIESKMQKVKKRRSLKMTFELTSLHPKVDGNVP